MGMRDSLGDRFALVLCLLAIPTRAHNVHAQGPKNGSCIESEKAALLAFKANLTDPGNRLLSWKLGDCCRWRGVSCNSETGHVVKLDLHNNYDDQGNSNTSTALSGEINPSLLALFHLNYLDLSSNEFDGIRIPEFIASFRKLRYLNLSYAGFWGPIPSSYANLSSLRYLDLGGNYDATSDNLAWLSGLPNLKYLDLSWVSLAATSADWLLSVNARSSISVLWLRNCSLQALPASLPHFNLTAVTTLDLWSNEIKSSMPQWLGNLSSMAYLDVSWNSFHGWIPDALGNLTSLEVLRLGHNSFKSSAVPATFSNLNRLKVLDLNELGMGGEITDFLIRLSPQALHKLTHLGLSSNGLRGNLSVWPQGLRSLTYLDLSQNLLQGHIPPTLGKQLPEIRYLDLTGNSLEGVVTEATFANMFKLQAISLAYNSLTIAVDDEWVPPFQLENIALTFCRLGPRFPKWLRSQRFLDTLYLESTGITDTLPDWFWNSCASCSTISLSNNSIAGGLPQSLEFMSVKALYLSSNQLQGPIPRFPRTILYLDLSNNSFSGPMLLVSTGSLVALSLSSNHINGSIPPSICRGLRFLDLSNNQLSGQLPNCWNESDSELFYINLANNNLSGKIPRSMSFLTSLQILILRNNSFNRVFPLSLKSCQALALLDLADNRFSGSIPPWISESFPSLQSLQLRSNTFDGSIPPQLSELEQLRLVDLAHNNLSGYIPDSFGNFRAMASTLIPTGQVFTLSSVYKFPYVYVAHYENMPVLIKGQEFEDSNIDADLIKSIDLSNNDLSGEIPEQIGKLSALTNLNLSGNHLRGNIPESIGGLRSLESLDLCINELSGRIPMSILSLTSLSSLNLSYNSLSGRIPSERQPQTLDDPLIYIGNAELCGPPVEKNCSGTPTSDSDNDQEKDKGFASFWFYLGIGIGYMVGFAFVMVFYFPKGFGGIAISG